MRKKTMNNAYRLLWSHVFNSWVVVAETARGRSKGSGRKLVAAALSWSAVAAQAAGPVVPNAGSILQQVQPVAPPTAPSNDTGLRIEQPSSSALPPSASFLVSHIDITGNTKIDTPTLRALVVSAEGRNLTLPELGELAARITDYYHAQGYPLARAIVPAQTMQSGIVRIEVIEARFGAINLDNQSRVSDRLLLATLGGLKAGAVVTQAEMDRNLLLLSDIPGLAVNATLKPGAAVGTSDLQVNTASSPMVTGNVTADNGGDRYSGRARAGATVNLINPLHQGDIFSVSGLSAGRDMNYGRVSYDALVDGVGTRVGASYSALNYRLGGQLSPLDAHGTAQIASLWTKQPFIRSRDLNVYGQIQYDHMHLDDDINTSDIETDRHLDNVTTSVSGDMRDGLLAGAVTTWSASWTYGHVGFENAEAQLVDAVAADTQGGFSKWNLNVVRLQSLGTYDALYLSVAGQWASSNLDSSQQMIAGGPSSVRAYDVSAVSGDSGYLLTAELRHTFPRYWYGQWQAIAFVDAAHVSVNQHAFEAGSNTANLGGVGVGLNWAGPYQLDASASLATPVGAKPQLVGSTSSVRVWLQLSKGF
jgi:hemolysin activation/secretion protein